MATSINCGPAWLMDGPTYNGLILRTNHVAASFFNSSAAAVRGGVMPSGGQMVVTAGSGMSVNVATGYALCPSSTGSTSGGYLFGLMTAGNLTVATSDPTNPRVDLVCAVANDLGTSGSAGLVEILTGTPTAGATLGNLNGAPALPANGIILAYILVPAGSSSVTSGNVSYQAVETTAQGGILPVAVASAPAGYAGHYLHDLTSGRLMQNPASGPAQPLLLPVAPQQARTTATVTPVSSGAQASVASVTVTCDGNTDLECMLRWPALTINNSAAFGVYGALMQLYLDSTLIAEVTAPSGTNATGTGMGGKTGAGGMFTHVTQSGVDRPSAGSHTLLFAMLSFGDGTHPVTMPCNSGNYASIYVRAAPL